ncbi:MAG: hypothetical protein IJB71_04840 [Bacilli bacterium]|nr:hypothetical protein [Bacilli bacterium]
MQNNAKNSFEGFYDRPESSKKTIKKIVIAGGIVLALALPLELIKVDAVVDKTVIINPMMATLEDSMIDGLKYDELTNTHYITQPEIVEMSLGSAISQGHKIKSFKK